MTTALIESPPRWILPTLMSICALLAVAILSVRSPGIIAIAHRTMEQQQAEATAAFAFVHRAANAQLAVDSVRWGDHQKIQYNGAVVRIPAGEPVVVDGWAVDKATNAPFRALYARIDGSAAPIAVATMGIDRPDVAQALNNPVARTAGFELSVGTTGLLPGEHNVELRAFDSNRKVSYAIASKLKIRVEDRLVRGTVLDAIDAVNGILLTNAGPQPRVVTVEQSYGTITITGWGFLAQGPRLANGVMLDVDNGRSFTGSYHLLRTDVANVYHDVRLAKSGFSLTFPADSLPLGRHQLSLRFDAGNNHYIESNTSLVLILE